MLVCSEVDSDDDDEYFISPMEFCDAKLGMQKSIKYFYSLYLRF